MNFSRLEGWSGSGCHVGKTALFSPRNNDRFRGASEKKTKGRNEEMKSDFARMRPALGFLQILVLQILGFNVETWKRGDRAVVLTFGCALEASDLRGIHLQTEWEISRKSNGVANCSGPEIHLQINKYLQISTKSTVTALSQRPEGVKRRQELKPWWTTWFCQQ